MRKGSKIRKDTNMQDYINSQNRAEGRQSANDKNPGNIRTVDTGEYLSMLRELTEEGREVGFRITGSSMNPFLVHLRDTAIFKKPDRPLCRGDIVFYQRDSGQYVCHRIQRVCGRAASRKSRDPASAEESQRSAVSAGFRDGVTYDLIGDNQIETEHGVRPDQIFGLVVRVNRGGKVLTPESFWWKFFARVWIRIVPLRYPIMRIVSMFHRGRG